jgi:rhodanese-related sulfurtransferase
MNSKKMDAKAAYDYFAKKLNYSASPAEIQSAFEKGEKLYIYDVRKKDDYEKGHIPGAINLPEGAWAGFKGFAQDANSIFYSYNESCHLSAQAAYQFAEAGYPVVELKGGYQAWKDAQYAIEGKGKTTAFAGSTVSGTATLGATSTQSQAASGSSGATGSGNASSGYGSGNGSAYFGSPNSASAPAAAAAPTGENKQKL